MRFVVTSVANSLVVAFLVIVPLLAVANDDSTAITQEILELRKGQEAILRELAEIKKLLADRPPSPARPAVVQQIDAPVSLGDIALRGDPIAPLTLIEFSDYQCPFCKRHAEQTLPQLLSEYVDSGKLRYVFRDFPLESLHPKAAKAAEAARCAGDQSKFWEMHDRLFANQRALDPDNLVEHANAIGLDAGSFKACLDEGKYASAVKKDIEEGEKLAVNGTPTFVLGVSAGDMVRNAIIIRGAQPFAVFKSEIGKLLSGAIGAKN